MRNYFVSITVFCIITSRCAGVISVEVETNRRTSAIWERKNIEKPQQQQDQFNTIDEIYTNKVNFESYTDDISSDDKNWDLIIFTQQWPVTLCYHWREEDKNHSCTLPTAKEFWTIHGLWPTKLGHMGPNFCNKSAEFDIDKLQSISNNLEKYWPDIAGASTNSQNWLWKHEWLKHGTCAALLQTLDNERKYFGQGLIWRQSYNISDILDQSDIHPDSINNVVGLQSALFKVLGKNPSIHCVYDNKKDVNFLSEIRLCFNRQLELIDCNGVQLGDAVIVDYPGGNVITNCHISKPVHYPSNVPPLIRRRRPQTNHQWHHSLVDLYKMLQFIMWATL